MSSNDLGLAHARHMTLICLRLADLYGIRITHKSGKEVQGLNT